MSQFKTTVWEDDFKGPTLDYSKWECEVNAFGGGNDELQLYTDHPRNVRVEDSKLILQAHHGLTNAAGTLRDYSSGRVRSKHRGDWMYGRIEVCAKIPTGQGLWPAIWMMPTDEFYGPWATSGEIDIMENKGHQPRTVSGALHYGGVWPDNKFVHHVHRRGIWRPKFSDAFVTYSIEWDADGFSWFVNDELVAHQRPGGWGAKSGNAPFDRRFHLVMNLAVGGRFPGNPTNPAVCPASLEVDWVRVFQ